MSINYCNLLIEIYALNFLVMYVRLQAICTYLWQGLDVNEFDIT